LDEVRDKMDKRIVLDLHRRAFLDEQKNEAHWCAALTMGKYDARNELVAVCTIYRHICGEIVMHTHDAATLTIETLVEDVLPMMAHFDEMCLAWDMKERGADVQDFIIEASK